MAEAAGAPRVAVAAFHGGPFSQWARSTMVAAIDGHEYTFATAEHYMMARKAALFGDQAALRQILKAKTPREAKQLGRQVRHFKVGGGVNKIK